MSLEKRVEKLEEAMMPPAKPQLLAAADHAEAQELEARHAGENVLVVITGVPRAPNDRTGALQ